MQNFRLYNPTEIIFGRGEIAALRGKIPPSTRVLITYGGGSVRRNGVLDQVKEALKGYDVREFAGIEPNPSYETLMEGVERLRSEGIDFLLAVGGGSVIDGTKFMAAAALFEGEPWDILTKRGAGIQKALPFGTVLTLPATGSEMNSGSVITRKSLQAKLPFASPHVFPVFSILDPETTYTLPDRQISNGVIDAFVHVMEQYLTWPAGAKVQDRFSEGLLQTLIEEGPRALEAPDDYGIRANLMWTATMALNGLIGAGVPQDWTTHMIGHELTALYGLDHAQTLAIVLPGVLQERREPKGEKLLQYAKRIWGLEGADKEAVMDAAIEKTREFFERMGVKTRLSDYGIGAEGISRVVEQLQAHGMKKLGEHRDITPEISGRILDRCL
ncbi:iron-containing alcohol dehydrogenase [Desulfobotulus sp. H1]|uniref:Iron-containing alcohol dehydrogenase n=1 Tax=Desulfobotulus pelophilus TaxID=2823377 RepID=A0ABT3N8Y7_9BACT|nr:iron-containing alcohol dehydrogenase [Desulfobotulus pelophilus]MCW7753920.1 iron-containing alcohol dehydrogenase [Desulfobotulus pelophilus]